MHRRVWTAAIAATALLITAGPVAAQDRRPLRFEERVERTAESIAEAIERNVELWAEQFERNAEKWAEDVERNAEKWADQVERHVEKVALKIEANVEAAGQDSDAARRRREIQREAEERRRAARRDAEERRREAQRERAEQQRGDVRDWPEVTEPFSRTLRLGRGGIVDIANIAGDITITGGGGDDVRIEAIKRVRNPSESQARTLLEALRIDVTERPGRIEIRTQHPRVRSSSGEVTYTLSVPAGIDVVVKTVSGDLRVTNIRGELRAEAVSGDVIASGIARIQAAKTVSGNVEITGAEGDIVAGSVSGDVILKGAKGRSATLNTVSGDVRLFDADLERATVSSMNGDVEYAGRLARGGRYDLNTHSGDIRITPAGNTGFELEANTFNGDVVSEYALKLIQQSDATGRRNFNRQVRGSFGDAGAVITVRSFNGDITIVKR